MTWEALLTRMAGGLPGGSVHTLPIAAISALAEAQRQQEIARTIIIRSAMADTKGGKRGTNLSDTLYDEDLYDGEAARVVLNPTIVVDILIAELVAGVIPHAAIMLIIVDKYHGGTLHKGGDLYAAAEAANLCNDKGLCIT